MNFTCRDGSQTRGGRRVEVEWLIGVAVLLVVFMLVIGRDSNTDLSDSTKLSIFDAIAWGAGGILFFVIIGWIAVSL
jgi:Na+-translocating ferredoxin:NAD+ oxidoreductase RnfE subunit